MDPYTTGKRDGVELMREMCLDLVKAHRDLAPSFGEAYTIALDHIEEGIKAITEFPHPTT